MERLRILAMHSGIAYLEFLDLTPQETFWEIDASIWRAEIAQKQNLTLAWQTAALTRAKKMPSLKVLLNTKPAKPLRGEELQRRKQEFADMTKNLDLSKLNIKVKHG